MKVGTDAVLLACLVNMENTKSILDIGCGSGIISLICAQKSNAQITGIDIDLESVKQAKYNFSQTPWSKNLSVECVSVQEYAINNKKRFDLIITNPPFFSKSMKSANPQRNIARHNDTLSSIDLLNSSNKILTPAGKLAIILPFIQGDQFIDLALQNSLYLERKISIFPKASKKANRLVLVFALVSLPCKEESIIIREESNKYTKQYQYLTKDFYLAF